MNQTEVNLRLRFSPKVKHAERNKILIKLMLNERFKFKGLDIAG